jgi:hypothetical protein
MLAFSIPDVDRKESDITRATAGLVECHGLGAYINSTGVAAVCRATLWSLTRTDEIASLAMLLIVPEKTTPSGS